LVELSRLLLIGVTEHVLMMVISYVTVDKLFVL
jgi:hypothetical protein